MSSFRRNELRQTIGAAGYNLDVLGQSLWLNCIDKLAVELVAQSEVENNHLSGRPHRHILETDALRAGTRTYRAVLSFLRGLKRGSVFLVALIRSTMCATVSVESASIISCIGYYGNSL